MSDATATPAPQAAPAAPAGKMTQAELVQKLIDAGVHLGSPVSRWNPKMAPYIQGKRGALHVINVKETLKGIILAKKLIQKTVAGGKDVLFVGTKRQARNVVAEEADRCGMPYVSERWLGGTLTNFRTIRARLNRLDELDKLWETGQIDTYSKKMKATLGRERLKIKTNLEGIRRMEKMPGLMFIIDTRREHIAVKEAKKLGVPTAAVIDTDSDPELIDLPVPGNDDSMRALELIMHELADAAIAGKQGRSPDKQGAEGGDRPQRRSSRAAFKSDNSQPEKDVADGVDSPQPGKPGDAALDPNADPSLRPTVKLDGAGETTATVKLPVPESVTA